MHFKIHQPNTIKDLQNGKKYVVTTIKLITTKKNVNNINFSL